MLLQQLVGVIFMLAPLASAHIGGTKHALDQNPAVYCGRALARMVAFVCYDEYSEDVDSEKRSGLGTMYGALIPPYYKEQENQLSWPWMSSKSSALGSIRGKRFTSGGISDECCDKPCRLAELLNYCSYEN